MGQEKGPLFSIHYLETQFTEDQDSETGRRKRGRKMLARYRKATLGRSSCSKERSSWFYRCFLRTGCAFAVTAPGIGVPRSPGPHPLPVSGRGPPPQASAVITCVDMVTPAHRSPPRHGRAGRPRSAPEGWHRFSRQLSAASFPSASDRRPHRQIPGAAAPLRALPEGPPRRHFVRRRSRRVRLRGGASPSPAPPALPATEAPPPPRHFPPSPLRGLW